MRLFLPVDGYMLILSKLMLQTAPVALLFPPTVGPDAKLDGSPFRYDFNGSVEMSPYAFT